MIKTPDGLTLMLPNAIDSLVFDEIYLMQVYGKPDLTRKAVIDVGAAIGYTAALFFKKCGAKSVYGYELDEARVRIAEKNIEMNGMGDSVVVYITRRRR
jgi:predicted RNA methylase